MSEVTDTLQTDSLAKGIGFLAVANMAQRAIGFLRNIAFCYFLTKTDVGLWALASSFFVLAAPLSVLGLPGCFGRYVETFRQQGQLRSFISRTLAIATVSVLILSFSLLLFSSTSSDLIFGQKLPFYEMLAITITLLVVVTFNTLMELLSGLRQPTAVSQMQLVSSVSFSFFSLPALMCWPGWTSVVACYCASMALGLIPGVMRLRQRCETAFSSKEALETRDFIVRVAPLAITVWLTDILGNLFDVVDRYMLLHLASSDTEINQGLVGQFHTARLLPVLFLSLASMLAGLLLPYWSSDWESKNRERVVQSLSSAIKMIVVFFWLFSLVALVGAPLLFGVLFEGRYAISEACFPIALAHCVVAAVAMLQCSFMRCIEANKWSIAILLAAFGLNVWANSFAVPRYGVAGAMYATLGSTIIMVGLNALVLYRRSAPLNRASFLVMILPLTLLLPVAVSLAALFVTIVLAGRTDYLFNQRERNSMDNAVLPLLNRIGIGLQSLWPHPSGQANG